VNEEHLRRRFARQRQLNPPSPDLGSRALASLPPRSRGHRWLRRLSPAAVIAGGVLYGNAIVYRPRLSEARYLTGTIEHALAGASPDARQVALAGLLGGLAKGELSDLQQLARQVSEERKRR